MKTSDNKKLRIRTAFVGVLFGLGLMAIGLRAVHLQVFDGQSLRNRAIDEYTRPLTVKGKRGSIYDANRSELAMSIVANSIAVNPRLVEDPRKASRQLARALNLNAAKLQRKMTGRKGYFVYVKRRVTPQEGQAVRDLNLAGIQFVTENQRVYPQKSLAAQIIGFTGSDGGGLEGIEYYYNKYLKPGSASLSIVKDARGKVHSAAPNRSSLHDGMNLVLTLDRAIQYITETALNETLREFRAKSAMAIVMVPQTGEILALAHLPTFNPNTFGSFDQDTWRNRAITDPFEPGSTMKIFTVAGAIEAGLTTRQTMFNCENGSYRVGRDNIHDTKPHEWLSLAQIVKLSSNIGAAKVGEILGRQKLYDTLRLFGFGGKTGIDCPGESAGILSAHDRWSAIDAATIAFGQGISVSAIQLLSATSAIANGGVLMRPRMVKAIIGPDNQIEKLFPPQQVQRVVSPETAAVVASMMLGVTQTDGTGPKAALDGYRVCGKTGTAQKVNRMGRYDKEKYTSSFVGFTPAAKPKIAILVVVDEPKGSNYGGLVAAPVFHQIAKETLSYLNVPPETRKRQLRVALDHGVKG